MAARRPHGAPRALAGAVGSAASMVLTACGGPTPVQDESTCPGPSCTDDTGARYHAVAALDDVTGVASVSRSLGLDRGSARSAEIRAAVSTEAGARELGLAVLRELEEWPGHADGPAEVTIRSDPPVTTAGTATEVVDLDPTLYDSCAASECEQAVRDLGDRLRAEVQDLSEVTVRIVDRRLAIRGRAPPDRAAVAARAAIRLVQQLGLRVARRADAQIRHRGPLLLRLRLDGGWVCPQPAGVVEACRPGNSFLLTGEPVDSGGIDDLPQFGIVNSVRNGQNAHAGNADSRN